MFEASEFIQKSGKISINYYWHLKELRLTLIIKRKIIKRSTSSNSLHGRCNLCLEGKICILKYKDGNLLNTRKELIIKYRHRNKLLI